MRPDQEVKLTVQQIRDAAEHCSTARGVLKKMFPNAFADDLYCFKSGAVLAEHHAENVPFYIGTSDAKIEHRNKILIMEEGWSPNVYPDYFKGRPGITFSQTKQ